MSIKSSMNKVGIQYTCGLLFFIFLVITKIECWPVFKQDPVFVTIIQTFCMSSRNKYSTMVQMSDLIPFHSSALFVSVVNCYAKIFVLVAWFFVTYLNSLSLLSALCYAKIFVLVACFSVISIFSFALECSLCGHLLCPYVCCCSYGLVRRMTPEEKQEYESNRDNFRPLKKSKMAAWFVSNCDAHSGRDSVVLGLKRYIPVCFNSINFCNNINAITLTLMIMSSY